VSKKHFYTPSRVRSMGIFRVKLTGNYRVHFVDAWNKKISLGTKPTLSEAEAVYQKFLDDGIIPLKPFDKRGSLDRDICPGLIGSTNRCDGKPIRCFYSYHNEQDESLLGICCSLVCLNGRYQSHAFRDIVAKHKETIRQTARAKQQSYRDMVLEIYQDDDGDKDIPFTLEEQNSNAALYYSSLIQPLLGGLQRKGISNTCAFGIQYSLDYRGKAEGMSLLGRKEVKRDMAKCGLIAKATSGFGRTSESKGKSLVSMVIVSCNPGRSLIEWESEMQRLCLKDASHGNLNDVCLMFSTCDNGGGAYKYCDVPGYRAQLVLSLWVPKRWKGMVESGFSALVAEMEKKRSFPDVLRGQLMPATDDPLGMKLPYAPFEAMLRKKNDTQLRTFLRAFKGMGSKSTKRVEICKGILDERSSV
jgi:hypothetical protein